VKYAFIESDLRDHDVKRVCKVLGVSCSGFYKWRVGQSSSRVSRREELATKIQAAHAENRGVYGSPRIHQVLLAQGERVCLNTVASVMKERKIRAKTKKKYIPRTTDSAHDQPISPNRLDREFAATLPNQKWVTDITYIPTDEGWLYLAGVMDLCSRKIVGWAMREHLEASLASEALRMAIVHRNPGAGLLHHSDRGSQYASDDYQKILKDYKMESSMSGKGDCWDNAAAESFWSTLKTELVHHQHYATRDEARQSIFEYIEVFYNRKRLHSSIGYMSPETFEASLN
jgi:transposase InsO family protein